MTVNNLTYLGKKLADLFSKLNSSDLADIAILWSVGVEACPERTPDLYQNEPLLIAVKFNQPLADSDGSALTGHIHGYYNDGSLWQNSFTLTPPKNQDEQPNGIAKLWARHKIEALLDTHYTGASPEGIKSAVLPVALKHGLLSPYTSFVAITETNPRQSDTPVVTEQIALMPPAGTSLSAPQTATTSLPMLLLGALLASCALALNRRCARWRYRTNDLQQCSTSGTRRAHPVGSALEAD